MLSDIDNSNFIPTLVRRYKREREAMLFTICNDVYLQKHSYIFFNLFYMRAVRCLIQAMINEV